MSENLESYWVIPDIQNAKTPLTLFREAANELPSRTDDLLRARIVRDKNNNNMGITLSIYSPLLNDYSVDIMRYIQPLTLYPGKIFSLVDGVGTTANSEMDLKHGIKEILSRENTQAIISSLMLQSRAEEDEIPF